MKDNKPNTNPETYETYDTNEWQGKRIDQIGFSIVVASGALITLLIFTFIITVWFYWSDILEAIHNTIVTKP